MLGIPSCPHTSPLRLQSGREGCYHFTDEQPDIQAEQAVCPGPHCSRVKNPAHHVVSCPHPASPASVPWEALSFHKEKHSTSLGPGDTALTGETAWVNCHTSKDTGWINSGIREGFPEEAQLRLRGE